MTRRSQFSKRMLAGLVGISAAATLVACNQPTDTAGTDSTTVSPDAAVEEIPAPAEDPTAQGSTATGGTVAELAASDESFSTLAAAIEAAGLTETLSGEGPYTVFAPTNEAFAALPEGALDQLLLPENREILTQVLTYHVVPQELPSSAITSGEVATVEGAPVTVTASPDGVTVNNATVIQPDIEASNGVIHAVDQVILPPGAQL